MTTRRQEQTIFARHSDLALFVAGGLAFAAVAMEQQAAVKTILVLVGAGLMLVGVLLPRLSGTIKISHTGIELQVLQRLEATRQQAELRMPDRVPEALWQAYESLLPLLIPLLENGGRTLARMPHERDGFATPPASSPDAPGRGDEQAPEAEDAADEAAADDTRPGLIDRVKPMAGLEDRESASDGVPGSTVRIDEPERGEEPGARAESERAAREALQAQAERAAREVADAERAAREAAEAEARARAEQQARRQAELDARAKAEAEARAAADARAREQAQRASREEAEQAAREAGQAQAREAAEAQARERAEAQARHRDEAAAKARAESAARREAEQAAERARRAAALVAKQEAAASPPKAEPRSDGPAGPTRPVPPHLPAAASDGATAEPPWPGGASRRTAAHGPAAQARAQDPPAAHPDDSAGRPDLWRLRGGQRAQPELLPPLRPFAGRGHAGADPVVAAGLRPRRQSDPGGHAARASGS